jgi:hypothetical protein
MLAGTEYVGVKDISTAGCIGSSDSSVGIVTGYKVDEREIMFRVPAEKIAVRSFPCRSDQF